MPWGKNSDALRHTKKAKTPKLQRMWRHVANGMMERGVPEVRAIRAANAVVKRRGKKKRASISRRKSRT